MGLEINEDGLLVLTETGFEKVEAPEPTPDLKYAISGEQSQVLTVKLAAGESIKTEPGIWLYNTGGITPESECAGCMGRCCAGEDCWVVNYTNESEDGSDAFIACTPTFPTAKVIPLDMVDERINGVLRCQQGAYIANMGEVEVTFNLDCNPCRSCCAGTGFIQQEITGTGIVFLSAVGTIVQKNLEEGESIIVDTECVLAWAQTVKIEVRRAGGIFGMIGGGEGIFNTLLTGPGMIMIQSFNRAQLLATIKGTRS